MTGTMESSESIAQHLIRRGLPLLSILLSILVVWSILSHIAIAVPDFRLDALERGVVYGVLPDGAAEAVCGPETSSGR